MAIDVYFESFWNKLDALALILFYVGFGLRFVASTECFCFSRIFLSIDLTLWFIRSLDLFAAVKRLGPNLVMIESMVFTRTISLSTLFDEENFFSSRFEDQRSEILHVHGHRFHSGFWRFVARFSLRNN